MATDNPSSHFEFTKDPSGFHRFHLQAANNEVVASGEGYVNSAVEPALDLVYWAADALDGTPEFLEKPLTLDQINRLVSAGHMIDEFLLRAQGA